MRQVERLLMMRTIDSLWVDHLTAMDEMRQGIGLQAYGQTDPLVAYKREAHDMYDQLLANIRRQVTHSIYHVEVTQRPAQPARAPVTVEGRGAEAAPDGNGAAQPATAAVAAAAGAAAGGARAPVTAKSQKIGRNEPCPCGSGKKYKKCHGMAA
jgi:preprotein translocase subunit SecA